MKAQMKSAFGVLNHLIKPYHDLGRERVREGGVIQHRSFIK